MSEAISRRGATARDCITQDKTSSSSRPCVVVSFTIGLEPWSSPILALYSFINWNGLYTVNHELLSLSGKGFRASKSGIFTTPNFLLEQF